MRMGWQRVGLVLAGAIVVGAGLWMTAQAWSAARAFSDRPFDYDEAIHALPAYQAAQDLAHGDGLAFWANSLAQDSLAAYPFLHSWLIAPFLIPVGADTVTARLANTVFVWLSAGLAAVCAWRLALHPGHGPWAAVTAAGSVMFSLPVWVYANTVLLEAAGLTVTLAWLAAYLHWGRPPARPAPLIAISLLAAATFFVKYSFGVFVVGGMVLAESVFLLSTEYMDEKLGIHENHPGFRPGIPSNSSVFMRWVWLFGPAGVLIGLWLLLPDKFERLVGYSGAQAGNLPFWSLANWLYVPANSLRLYSAGPLSAGLMAAALLIGVGWWRRHVWRAVTAAVLVGMLALTWVPQKDARFLYTVAPLLLPAAAALGVHLASWIWRAPPGRWLLVTAIGLELGLGLRRLTLYRPALATVYNTSPDTHAALVFALEHSLIRGSRPMLVNGWYQLNAQALSWEYYARFGGAPAGDDYQLAVQAEFDQADSDARQALLTELEARDAGTVITVDGSPAGDVTGWQLVEPLVASGDLILVAQSPAYTLTVWPRDLQERLLAGEATSGVPVTFEIRLNVYSR